MRLDDLQFEREYPHDNPGALLICPYCDAAEFALFESGVAECMECHRHWILTARLNESVDSSDDDTEYESCEEGC